MNKKKLPLLPGPHAKTVLDAAASRCPDIENFYNDRGEYNEQPNSDSELASFLTITIVNYSRESKTEPEAFTSVRLALERMQQQVCQILDALSVPVRQSRRLQIIKDVYGAVIDNTEVLGYKEIGVNLAYLLGAITQDKEIELPEGDALLKILEGSFPRPHSVWKHVQITTDT